MAPTDVPASAPDLSPVAIAMHDLTAVIARLNLRLDAIAADVALLRAMADAERQADGRAAYPQPRGWVR